MSIGNVLKLGTATLAIASLASLASAQAAMKSADQVQKALGTLNRVVDHTGRLIKAKNYTQLPHENGEFKEGTEALEKFIANEPSDFKAKVAPLLKTALASSQSVADAATAHDDAKLATTHAAFGDAVKKVLAAFPASVQPPALSRTQEKAEESREK
jgi:hypothetical protein